MNSCSEGCGVCGAQHLRRWGGGRQVSGLPKKEEDMIRKQAKGKTRDEMRLKGVGEKQFGAKQDVTKQTK